MKLRPEVQAFAEMMEAKLQENDDKGGWQHMGSAEVFVRLIEEAGELAALVDRRRGLPPAAWRAKLGSEAADVANFAMMLADVCGALVRQKEAA